MALNSNTLGALLGAVGGAGLGTLTASMANVNPAIGLLGAIPGAISGGKIGQWCALNAKPQEYMSMQRMQQIAQELDSRAGSTFFTEALAEDPEGFRRNIAAQYVR